MNASAREIALHALRNYLVGDLELTPADAGEVITVALARALARAVAERHFAEADVDLLLGTVRRAALDGPVGAMADGNALRWPD
jgi:hypothetical protein